MESSEFTAELPASHYTANPSISHITQVLNFSNCWVTPQLFGIQTSDFLRLSESLYPSKGCPYSEYYEFNGLFVRYLFTVSKSYNSSPYTRYNGLHLLQMCVKADKEIDMQLTGLVCLLLSSKFYDKEPIDIDLLFKASQGCYSMPQFIEKEKEILTLIDYNVHRPGYLYDKILLYYHIVTPLIPSAKSLEYFQLCVDLCDLLHECPFWKFLKKYALGLLAAAVLHSGLVISIKAEGKFPVTVRLSKVSGFSEDEIRLLSKKILKHSLGKEIYDNYDF
eukprot:TRINITY_DN12699_c0_g3_i1.p1 TRINITY_DN12699_c0_g3~~TRINITY_DN12699_c0_g3_i1.p1  ORF type:complete len:298 (+),score=37.92 TRINITY_DN12699_c0_g3_i1:61-894(+)